MQSIGVCIAAGVLITLDVISGIVKGLYKKKLNSATMRKGFYRKLGEVLAVIVLLITENIGVQYDIGVLPSGVCIAFCSYISIMEVISIVENICELNPKIKAFFEPYLEKFKSKEENKKDDQ